MRAVGSDLAIAAAVVAMVAATTAIAATITVNTSADSATAGDGACALREALANVNAATDTTGGDCTAGSGAGDTVAFNLQLPARIRLTLGELIVEQDVTIAGPSTGSLRISGGHASRVFTIDSGTTAMSNLIIEQGSSDLGSGGAIRNNGTLSLTSCTLSRNKAMHSSGGAIDNSGSLTLTGCTLTGNKADVAGAIENAHILTITNSTFARNRARCGGAISNEAGATTSASITGSTMTRNRSPQCGGAFNNYGTLNLTNCTLARNRGNAGGGIQNQGALALANCTLQGNKAIPGSRGGLGGGGIWHTSFSSGSVTMINTIVTGSGASSNCGGDPITAGGHNLSSDDTCSTGSATDLLNTEPLLAPLGDYGGPTPTMALCGGAGASCSGSSPAIDAGDDAVTGEPLNLSTDQRGLPRLAGAHVDIGAYEAQ